MPSANVLLRKTYLKSQRPEIVHRPSGVIYLHDNIIILRQRHNIRESNNYTIIIVTINCFRRKRIIAHTHVATYIYILTLFRQTRWYYKTELTHPILKIIIITLECVSHIIY